MTKREIVQADALSIAAQHKRCGLGISMGVGKTRIAIQHLQRNYNPFIKALVVIPKHSVGFKTHMTQKILHYLVLRSIPHEFFSIYRFLFAKNMIDMESCRLFLYFRQSNFSKSKRPRLLFRQLRLPTTSMQKPHRVTLSKL